MSESRERPSDPSEEREAESAERDEGDEQSEGEARESAGNGEAKDGAADAPGSDEEAEDRQAGASASGDDDAASDDEAEAADEDGEGKGTGTEEVEAEGEAAEDEAVGSIDVVYFGLTDVGLIRDHNEDNFLVADLTTDVRDLPEDGVRNATLGKHGGVFAVCDGMGGAAAGEVASQMAVDTVFDVLDAGDPPKDRDEFARRLVRAVEEAGTRIFSAAKMDRTRRGMGTTATVAGLIDKVLFVGQVGDSRAYVLRNDELGLITKDQSLVNQLIEAGQLSEDEAEAFEHSNIILQALGTTEEVSVDLSFLELRKGDRLMLCSDGLSGLVHEEIIKDVLLNTPDQREACEQLVEMANNGGGHDNITVVVADFDGDALDASEGAPAPSYQQYPLPRDEGEDETQQVGVQREPSQKVSTERKLGAEVKRGVGGERVAVAGEVRPFRWWLVAAVIVAAAVATAVALGLSKPGDGAQAGEGPGAGSPGEGAGQGAGATETEEPVEVRVRTDVTQGELFVDGQSYGRLGDEEEIFLHLPPGAYHFEARSGGNTVASANLTLRPGVPADVSLLVPSGTTDTVADLDGGGARPTTTDADGAPPERQGTEGPSKTGGGGAGGPTKTTGGGAGAGGATGAAGGGGAGSGAGTGGAGTGTGGGGEAGDATGGEGGSEPGDGSGPETGGSADSPAAEGDDGSGETSP